MRLLVGLVGAWAMLAALPASRAAAEECLRPEVSVRRYRHPEEPTRLALTTCAGEPNPAALEPLSLLARDGRLPRPDPETLRAHRAAHPHSAEVAPGVPRLHPGLLVRLQVIATRYPGHALVIVSGHRPRARRTSRHRSAAALDVAVDGVERAEVAALLRGLPKTGVGYYPNSTFTHVDVREESAYWVDRSGPGERPRYVRPPPAPAPAERRADARAVSPPPEGARSSRRAGAA
ncbi:MAG: DUF882 domain-containing protein, partial [Myxococcota bacterium]